MKLVERMPRVCKAVTKVKSGYFEEFVQHFFGYYKIPYVLFHSSDVFTIILQCSKIVKNQEKPWNEYVCSNF